MSFIDERFPVGISYGSQGGPQYSTSVISMRSGQEKRNINWEYPRHVYDAATGIRRISDLEDLIAFFHIAQGSGHTWRWKDWADYKSCKTRQTPAATDQAIGTGDGETTAFQLSKTYSYGSYTRLTRRIYKPVSGTVLVAIDGTATTAFSVDTDTGEITLDAAPETGAAVTAGFEFDVHARFETDELSTNYSHFQAGDVAVPVVEIKGS